MHLLDSIVYFGFRLWWKKQQPLRVYVWSEIKTWACDIFAFPFFVKCKAEAKGLQGLSQEWYRVYFLQMINRRKLHNSTNYQRECMSILSLDSKNLYVYLRRMEHLLHASPLLVLAFGEDDKLEMKDVVRGDRSLVSLFIGFRWKRVRYNGTLWFTCLLPYCSVAQA